MDELKATLAKLAKLEKLVTARQDTSGAAPAPVADKSVKTLLDGSSTDPAPAITETRRGTCSQHGDYLDQKTLLRAHVGRRVIAMPYWLGCPQCREAMEAGNRREAARQNDAANGWLIAGEPAWTSRYYRRRQR